MVRKCSYQVMNPIEVLTAPQQEPSSLSQLMKVGNAHWRDSCHDKNNSQARVANQVAIVASHYANVVAIRAIATIVVPKPVY